MASQASTDVRRPVRGVVACSVAVVLVALAAGCSSSDDATSSEPAATIGGVALDEITSASAAIGDRFGPVEAFAIGALALDQGYSTEQVVEGVDDLVYEGWGTDVLPEQPSGSRQGVIEPPDPDSGSGAEGSEGGSDEGSLGPVPGEVQLASVRQFSSAEARDLRVAGLARTLGELFRQSQEEYDLAGATGGTSDDAPEPEAPDAPDPDRASSDDAQLTDQAVLEAILVLAARGYSLEQIVLALAEGRLVPEGLDSTCWYIPGEPPDRADADPYGGPDDECTSLDEIASPSAPTGGGAPAPAPAPEETAPSFDGTYAGTLDRDVPIFDDYLDARGGTLAQNQAEVIVEGNEVVGVSAGFRITGAQFNCSVTATFTLESEERAAVVEGTASLGGSTVLAQPDCEGGRIVGAEPVEIVITFAGDVATMTFTFPAGTVRTATLERVASGD